MVLSFGLSRNILRMNEAAVCGHYSTKLNSDDSDSNDTEETIIRLVVLQPFKISFNHVFFNVMCYFSLFDFESFLRNNLCHIKGRERARKSHTGCLQYNSTC